MKKLLKKFRYTIQMVLFHGSYIAFFGGVVLSWFWSKNKFNTPGLIGAISFVVLIATTIWIANTRD